MSDNNGSLASDIITYIGVPLAVLGGKTIQYYMLPSCVGICVGMCERPLNLTAW